MMRKALFLSAVLVVAVLAAGCTTTMTTNSPSSSSVDMAAKLNNAFTSQNYTLITPFVQSVNQFGNAVYTGTVRDGPDTLVPYTHNMTVEETKNRSESFVRFDAYVEQALGQKYAELSLGNATGVWLGTNDMTSQNPPKEAIVRINEPNQGIMFWQSYVSVQAPNYTIAVDYMTKV